MTERRATERLSRLKRCGHIAQSRHVRSCLCMTRRVFYCVGVLLASFFALLQLQTVNECMRLSTEAVPPGVCAGGCTCVCVRVSVQAPPPPGVDDDSGSSSAEDVQGADDESLAARARVNQVGHSVVQCEPGRQTMHLVDVLVSTHTHATCHKQRVRKRCRVFSHL